MEKTLARFGSITCCRLKFRNSHTTGTTIDPCVVDPIIDFLTDLTGNGAALEHRYRVLYANS